MQLAHPERVVDGEFGDPRRAITDRRVQARNLAPRERGGHQCGTGGSLSVESATEMAQLFLGVRACASLRVDAHPLSLDEICGDA